MVDIATSTIAAAQVEDAIGSTGNLEHVSDPEVQVGNFIIIAILLHAMHRSK